MMVAIVIAIELYIAVIHCILSIDIAIMMAIGIAIGLYIAIHSAVKYRSGSRGSDFGPRRALLFRVHILGAIPKVIVIPRHCRFVRERRR